MGGCASKPKDMNFSQGLLPAESSTSPEPPAKDVQGEVPVQESSNSGGEIQKEEPLVDLSEPNGPDPDAPKSDGDAPESKTAIADLVSEIGEPSSDVNHETAQQTEDNVGSGDGYNTKEQTKDGPEVAESAGQIEVESHKSDVTSH